MYADEQQLGPGVFTFTEPIGDGQQLFGAARPLAFSPRMAASASLKSPVETPLRYSAGINASTLSHSAQVLGQDRTAKGLAVSVPNAGLTDRDRTHPRDQLALR
jgi:hypothetical protein